MKFACSLLSLVLLTTLSLRGQTIGSKFPEDATVKWLELRKKAFDSNAIAVERFVTESRPNAKSSDARIRKITDCYKQFTQGEFKYYEFIPLTDTSPLTTTGGDIPFNRRHVTAHNPHQTFFVSKDPESEWVLRDVEDSPDSYVFVEDSIKAKGRIGKEESPVASLSLALAKDPRLMISQMQTVDQFVSGILEYDENSFSNFKVSEDEALGQIVTVEFSCNVDWKERPRAMPKKFVKSTVNGEINFLADWSWLPISMHTTTRHLGDVGNEIRKTTTAVKAVYEPKQVDNARELHTDLMPQRVTISVRNEPTQESTEIIYRIRSLTADEIESIRKTQTLADFGLKRAE